MVRTERNHPPAAASEVGGGPAPAAASSHLNSGVRLRHVAYDVHSADLNEMLPRLRRLKTYTQVGLPSAITVALLIYQRENGLSAASVRDKEFWFLLAMAPVAGCVGALIFAGVWNLIAKASDRHP